MAIQNILAFYFRGEDNGSGGGNVREYTYAPGATSVVVGEPVTNVVSFSVPNTTNLAWFQNNSTATAGPVLVYNRSRYYFITLVCTVNVSGSTSATAYLPIAPSTYLFLPQNVTTLTAVKGGDLFDTTQAIPDTTQNLTLDHVVIQ